MKVPFFAIHCIVTTNQEYDKARLSHGRETANPHHHTFINADTHLSPPHLLLTYMHSIPYQCASACVCTCVSSETGPSLVASSHTSSSTSVSHSRHTTCYPFSMFTQQLPAHKRSCSLLASQAVGSNHLTRDLAAAAAPHSQLCALHCIPSSRGALPATQPLLSAVNVCLSVC